MIHTYIQTKLQLKTRKGLASLAPIIIGTVIHTCRYYKLHGYEATVVSGGLVVPLIASDVADVYGSNKGV